MRQHRKMAGTMGIIKNALLRMAGAPSLAFLMLTVLLMCSGYSARILAHDPGLSMVDIDLTAAKLSAHITYAQADIEQFVELDKDHDSSISEMEFAQAKPDLQQFIADAIEFRDTNGKILVDVIDIQMDASDAVHFMLILAAVADADLTVHSRMIDQFALGHRQFVKVTTAQGLASSQLLSAREPLVQIHLPKPDMLGVFSNFVIEGVWHIWIGFDHILFVITLLLPAVLVLQQKNWQAQTDFKQVFSHTVKVISAFTIAHSLTLGLTVFNIIQLPEQAVESIIAASVIVAACNNIFSWVLGRLWLLAFVFGLIHGMGFAAVLNELGLPVGTQVLALIGFNLGVELGQLAIIIVVLPLLYLFRKQVFYKPLLMQSGSCAIAVIATIWLFERMPVIFPA